jgi:uncharacterized protein involved in type VI secretion and phage assembly
MSGDVLARLLERVEGRFFGKYRAIVIDNDDPENRGRLRLKIPSVLGEDVVSGWALPCLPYGGLEDQGFVFIPEAGATVWVEFEGGNLDYPVWVGTFWGKPGGASEVPKPANEQRPPTRKMIKTRKGSIEIEDKDGEEVFIIQYNDGKKQNTVTMNKDGILVEDANNNTIIMSADGIELEDANANIITLDQGGVLIEDKNQNKIEMTSAAINIFPSVVCNLGEAAVNMVNNLPACLFTGAPHAMDAKGHAKFLK